jgi:hypothetical protein
MREVAMPIAFAAHRFRGSLALVAAWLIVLQAFLGGIVLGQTGALAAADPIDKAPICHGTDGNDTGGNGAPDSGKALHRCCVGCIGAAAALMAPAATRMHVAVLRPAGHLRPPCALTVFPTPRAVRAGPSQAPPPRA